MDTPNKLSTQSAQKYAMYLRKSRADLELEAMGEKETLARHKAMLDALAARNDIHPGQITIYRELVSGDSIDERPEMQRLLSDVYAKKYKAVLVVEVERLARGNTKDQGEVADAFQASNTHIITPGKVYDPNNEFDQEYFEFGLFMSRREYKTIKRRLEAGKKQSVMEGNYIMPQRVLGYDISRTTKKDRTLIVRPEEAKIVHMIFDWYTEERRSIGWIAKTLTNMGIPTARNRPEWCRGTIIGILGNPVYIGKVTWDKSKTAKVYDESAGKLVKKRSFHHEGDVFDGKHDGIISVEQFEKAQYITQSMHSPSVKTNLEIRNPFAGIMECCDCGRNIISTNFRDGRQSRLSHARDTICQKKSLPIVDVEKAFADVLGAYVEEFTARMKTEDNSAELAAHKARIDAIESELAKLERKRRKLFTDYEDEIYTRDEFIERKQHYNERIEGIKKQIQDARKSTPEPVNYAGQIVNLHAMIDCVSNPNISPKEKNDFLKQFVDKITYDTIDYGPRKGGKPILKVFLK